MKKLILYQGISGSGKTTAAKKWVEQDPNARVRFNYDDIRKMVGPYWVPGKRESLIIAVCEAGLKKAMQLGFDIVIDNMSNLNPKHVKEYEELIKEYNKNSKEQYELEFKIFNTPLDVCIDRDAHREISIGENIIKEQYKKYRNYLSTNAAKSLVNDSIKQDESLPHCIIIDLDGTLAFNVTGRPFWGDNINELVQQDSVNLPVARIVNAYKGKVIIITGREEACREGTVKWLNENHILYDILLMRPNQSFINAVTLKKNLLEHYIVNKYYVDFIIEDASKVVKMYRELGYTVLQPNDGNL